MAVKDGQNIFDIVLQHFGTLENTFDFMDDNTDLEFNSKLSSDQPITIVTLNKGDEGVKKFYSSSNFVLNNSQNVTSIDGAFNNDFNLDFDI